MESKQSFVVLNPPASEQEVRTKLEMMQLYPVRRYEVKEMVSSVFVDRMEIPYNSQRHIVVKCLPPWYTRELFLQLVGQFGQVSTLKFLQDKYTQECMGSAFVEFVDNVSAAKAILGLNNLHLSGTQNILKAGLALYKPSKQKRFDPTNVYVRGIPSNLSVQQFTEMFSIYGTVVESRVASNKFVDQWGRSRGMGFVRYASPDNAKTAIAEMNNAHIRDKNNPHNSFEIECKYGHESSGPLPKHPLLVQLSTVVQPTHTNCSQVEQHGQHQIYRGGEQ